MDCIVKNIQDILETGSRAYDVLIGMYSEAALLYSRTHTSPPTPDDAAALYCTLHRVTAPDCTDMRFALFCRELSEVFADRLRLPNDTAASEVTDSPPGISYLQNSFSDRAYKVFSSQFDMVTAQYLAGFREVCEDVYSGRSTHAILPIYSSADGHLVSFRKLITKYDLKIASVTDITANDDSYMRFALLKKGLSFENYRERRANHGLFMEISVILPDGMRYGGFISAAELFGSVLISTHSQPLEYSDDECEFTFRFDVTGADLAAMYMFLEGLQIRYDTVGLYNVL